MSKNVGEYDELRIKLRLIELRDAHKEVVISGKKFQIQSVSLHREFDALPKGTNLQTMTDNDIEKLANKVGAGKAKRNDKADVKINGVGYSVKSHRSAPPAIVNHTPRCGWYRICKELNIDIAPLDAMANEYFRLREDGVIGEDMLNTNPLSPFAKNKEYLRPLINYFLFKGTGDKASPNPASYILDCKDPYDISQWKIDDEFQYFDKYWNDMKFSFRNKGFTSYPYKAPKSLWKNAVCKPWAKTFDGKLKGSLHVRVI